MDTLIYQGDHKRDNRGFLETVSGISEKIQQAMIRFTVPKGAFKLDTDLGSLFHKLGQIPETIRNETALEYAREALLGMKNISVISATCKRKEQQIFLNLNLAIEDVPRDSSLVEVQLEIN